MRAFVARLLAVALGLAGLVGCAGGSARADVRSARARSPPDGGPGADGGPAAAPADPEVANAEEAWARRDDSAALEESVRLWERVASRPQAPAQAQVQALVRAARGRRLHAEQLSASASLAAVESAPGATSAELLAASARESEACAADARKAWTSGSPAAATALASGDPGAAFAQVSAPLAEALYLDALCASAWARAQGFTQLIEKRVELQAELSRAAVLAPDLDGAGPERELGKLFAALPAYAGGDLAEARRRFEAALARAPDSIATRVFFARSVAIKEQARALFESLLDAAQEAPARTPEDRAVQAEAHALRAREDELFEATAK
ncbi:MAG TPA: TRAP transporter TatT component family protein [Myxococcales bacterium]|nr:TRAP transporter TatT component family protein [Myxococcales bacterium]